MLTTITKQHEETLTGDQVLEAVRQYVAQLHDVPVPADADTKVFAKRGGRGHVDRAEIRWTQETVEGDDHTLRENVVGGAGTGEPLKLDTDAGE